MPTETKPETEELITIFNALGDKTRFKLYQTLRVERRVSVSELAGMIGITVAGVSQQLKVLEGAGLIERRRRGHKICYNVRQDRDLKKRVKQALR